MAKPTKSKAKPTKASSSRASASKASASKGMPKWLYGVLVGALLGIIANQINSAAATSVLVVVAVMAAYVLFASRSRKWSPTKLSRGPLLGALVVGVVSATGVHLLSQSSAQSIKVDANSIYNTNTKNCAIGVVGSRIASEGANRLGEKGSQFRELGNNTVGATVVVSGDANCVKTVTLASWSGPWGVNSVLPITGQHLFTSKTYNLTKGTHIVSVAHNNCRFQVDMLYGTAATMPDGTALYPEALKLGWVLGGNRPCYPPVAPPPSTPPPTTPPPAPCKDEGAGTTPDANGKCPVPCKDMGAGTAPGPDGKCRVCPDMGAGTTPGADGKCPVPPPAPTPPPPPVEKAPVLAATGPGNIAIIALTAVLVGYLFSTLSKAQWSKNRK